MNIELWFYSLPLRLRSLFYPQQVHQEIKEELREHLELQTAKILRKACPRKRRSGTPCVPWAESRRSNSSAAMPGGGSVLPDFV